jgi:hypothetical protein
MWLRLPARRFAVLLVVVSCESAPTVIPSPSPSVRARADRSSATPTVRTWLEDPAYFVQLENEMVVDGDRPLLLGLDFNVPMRQADVEDRLRATMPTGATYEWPSPNALRVNVPPGDSFDVVLGGSLSQGGVALPKTTWRIARPVTEVAVFRLQQGSSVWPAPARSWRLRLLVQLGMLILSPDGESALLYHGMSPRKTDFSLIDLKTGQHLGQPFAKIASNGWSVLDWTADDRLLVVAAAAPDTWLGDERGRDPVALRSFEGQAGLLSPSRRYVYLWACSPVAEAWLLDLHAGSERRLADDQTPCMLGTEVGWTPADELAIGDLSAKAPLTYRIRVFDPFGHRLRTTTVGFRPLLALASGACVIGHRISQVFRDDGGPFYLLDSHGVEHVLPDGVLFRPSPDGRFLAFTSRDGDTPIANVWSVSGEPPVTMRGATIGGWTKDGAVAIVTVVRP